MSALPCLASQRPRHGLAEHRGGVHRRQPQHAVEVEAETVRLGGSAEQEASSHEDSEKPWQQVPKNGALPVGRASKGPEDNEERHDDTSGPVAHGQWQRVPAAGLVTLLIPQILGVNGGKNHQCVCQVKSGLAHTWYLHGAGSGGHVGALERVCSEVGLRRREAMSRCYTHTWHSHGAGSGGGFRSGLAPAQGHESLGAGKIKKKRHMIFASPSDFPHTSETPRQARKREGGNERRENKRRLSYVACTTRSPLCSQLTMNPLPHGSHQVGRSRRRAG